MRYGSPPRGSSKQSGSTVVVALLLVVLVSAAAATMVMRATSENKIGNAYQDLAQSHYSSFSGLEEARGRLMSSAADAIPSSSIPDAINKVLYITNSLPDETVAPTTTTNPFYDSEFVREFPAGASATLVASDNPLAATTSNISYKWARVTLKTEKSSNTDINQDSVLNAVTPIVYDGKNQYFQTTMPSGALVYTVSALSVQPSGERRFLQYDIAASSPLTPAANLASIGNVVLGGYTAVNGNQSPVCTGAGPNIYGVQGAGTYSKSSTSTVSGSPTGPLVPTTLAAPTPSAFLSQFSSVATPILAADPTHVTYNAGTGTYTGTSIALGSFTAWPPNSPATSAPKIVYADHSLTINGGTGDGILLVQGDLTFTNAATQYYGIIAVTGNVSISGSSIGGVPAVRIRGVVLNGGTFTTATTGTTTGVDLRYDSCAVTVSNPLLPKNILGFRELNF